MGVTVQTITTCGNRFEHATLSVPTWIAQRTGRCISHAVTVVDYGSPERVCDWCREQNRPNLSSVRVERKSDGKFHLAHARNVGAIHANAELLCFSDVDLLWPQGWLQRYVSEVVAKDLDLLCANCDREHQKQWEPSFFGLCLVRADAFHAVRGFDEAFTDWGYEDVDFYERLRVRQFRCAWLSDDVTHLPPPSGDDFSGRLGKDNERLASDSRRIVNPDGYGR